MKYVEPADFAKRVRDNLSRIRDVVKEAKSPQAMDAKPPPAWEATQLVTAVLAILVVVRQEHLRAINGKPFEWLLGKGIRPDAWNDRHKETAGELVRRLRNGLSHYHWKFEATGEEIERIIISDQPCRNCHKPDFRIELTIEQLEDVFDKLVDLAIGTAEQAGGDT